MPDDEPLGLPGADLVGQFTDEIRAAIAGGIRSGTADVVKRFGYWCSAAVILAMVAGAVVSWLVQSYFQSRESGIQFRVQYGDTVAACARGVDLPGGTPVVVCNPVLR